MTAAKKTTAKKTPPPNKATAAETKVAAAEAEAKREPIPVEHAGLTYLIPHPLKFPLEIMWTEDEIEVTRLVLGEEQWATYLATKPTIEDFGEFSEALNAAGGRDTDSGN
ncbi:hypothetical protein ACIOEX_20040 [Streptomyces sp. NPDC087850]|uniref:hypothetical protein n=1 Tax=Streptomyces sp. NPDC087850 TaxID=3365809 RepID=UPI00381C42E6